MHLHTVYMEYAECLPNSFGPLAERNSFFQVRWRRCSTPDASGAWGRARDDGHCNHTGHHDSVIHVRHRAMRWNQRFRSQLTHALFPIVSNLPLVKLPRARCLGPSSKVRVQSMYGYPHRPTRFAPGQIPALRFGTAWFHCIARCSTVVIAAAGHGRAPPMRKTAARRRGACDGVTRMCGARSKICDTVCEVHTMVLG
jgi:hypothetical protein